MLFNEAYMCLKYTKFHMYHLDLLYSKKLYRCKCLEILVKQMTYPNLTIIFDIKQRKIPINMYVLSFFETKNFKIKCSTFLPTNKRATLCCANSIFSKCFEQCVKYQFKENQIISFKISDQILYFTFYLSRNYSPF